MLVSSACKQMHYHLARQGMMKKFQGSWKIEPKYDNESGSSSSENGENSDSENSKKLIGSWVNLQQMVQPALIPPWPLSNYVEGISAQILKDVCADLQQEAMRLAAQKAKSMSFPVS